MIFLPYVNQQSWRFFKTKTFINVNILSTIVNKWYTMLEKLFTSKTRTKILTLLMFNQDSEYHLREIARKIKISPIYVSKELANLEQLNLVNKKHKGNLTIYQINEGSVILNELKKIFIKTDYIGELIKNKLSGKVKYTFIYGSFANGTETESSDIDLFVVGDISEDNIITIIQELESKSGREINYVLWTEKVFAQRAKNHHLLRSIKKNKIIMLIGDENEFKKRIR